MTSILLTELKSILKDDLLVECDLASINENDGLQSVLGLDSVGFVELRVACENKFGINIPDADFKPENFSCLRVLADYIARQAQADR